MLCLNCTLPFEIVYFRVTEAIIMVMVIACVNNRTNVNSNKYDDPSHIISIELASI